MQEPEDITTPPDGMPEGISPEGIGTEDGDDMADEPLRPVPALRPVAWMVYPPSGDPWITDQYPIRFRRLGYRIVGLCLEDQVKENVDLRVRHDMQSDRTKRLGRQIDSMMLLAKIISRLLSIQENNFHYDTNKVEEDLMHWGLLERQGNQLRRSSKAGRLLACLELEWLRKKAGWLRTDE
ncbi:hypothetical protein LOC54_10265 [Acetobacter sp. AN02]|uniref:hypothetical protein n=1 Tax=Acetobacter sp. AN02 TaxID=2894186 RepID=UPI0024341638|nr:hypothetical protein [Acetobacter sp. AN02]MDG6095481.1 hypothetical protein [Acetobacter sp. AN02]